MHAILITFRPQAPKPEMMESFGPKMQLLAATPGLIMKTFVAPDEQTWGGFHLFTTKESAEAYLAGDFVQWMSDNPLVADIKTQHYMVEDDPSKAFGTPCVPLAESRAA